MSTNRPFMTNFFAAFRAHSVIQKAATTTSNPTSTTSTSTSFAQATSIHSSSSSPSPNASSNPRPINTKNQSTSTAAAVQAAGQFHPTRQHAPSPYSRSPNSPASPGFPIKSPVNKQRRGSDSSNEGFRETRGADKWYIGGRTASGEEKFYRLGMVKRHKSIDRLSLDRLSI